MIRFWFRELLGLFLILIGLYVLVICLSMLLETNPPTEKLLEAPVICFIGFVVFRGGIHLLKVAVAARIAMQPPADAPKEPAPDKRKKKSETPWDW